MSDLAPKLASTALRHGVRAIPDRDVVAEVNREHEALCRDIATCLSAARSDGGAREAALAHLIDALELHMRVEEDVLYPALASESSMRDALEVAQVEHRLMRQLVRDLRADDIGALQCRATLEVLQKLVRHHVEEEAYALMPRLRQSTLDLDALGRAMRERREALLAGGPRRTSSASMRLPAPRASRLR